MISYSVQRRLWNKSGWIWLNTIRLNAICQYKQSYLTGLRYLLFPTLVSPFTKPFLINIPNLQTIVFSNIPLEPILLKFTEYHPETPFAWVIKTLKELDPTNLREIKFQITIWDFKNLPLFPFARLKAALEAKEFPQLQHLTFVVSTKFMNGVASQIVSMITNFIKNESGLPEDKLRFEFTPDDLFGRWRNEQGVSLGPPMLLGHPSADGSQAYQSDYCFLERIDG